MAKIVTIKVYRPTGEFLKEWHDARFETFTKEINGGLGECIIKLGEKFDYSGNDLKLNNEVKIFVNDEDTVDEKGTLIYSGYISSFRLYCDEREEGIEVRLLGWYTLLAQDVWRDAPDHNQVTTFDYSIIGATDIGTIFRNLIGNYRAAQSHPKLSFTKDSLQTTSTTTEYSFEFLTYREAIDVLRDLAPANWWWFIDQWGTVFFQGKKTTIDHTFILGKHFSKVEVERSLEKLKNTVYFYANDYDGVGGQIFQRYDDDDSVTAYRVRAIKVRDDKIKTQTDADKIGEGFVDEHKDPDVKVIAEIFDGNIENSTFGYDIESIQPGDTCVFKGFDEYVSDIFKYIMLITRVEYYLNKAVITIEPMESGIIPRSEDLNKRVDSRERDNVPDEYTA